MDGISHCEALAKERGLPEGDDVWTLLFRKEMFSPWQSFIFDPIATNLVYNQIIYGSSLGDYRCSKVIIQINYFHFDVILFPNTDYSWVQE